jgi:hypothetical protein
MHTVDTRQQVKSHPVVHTDSSTGDQSSGIDPRHPADQDRQDSRRGKAGCLRSSWSSGLCALGRRPGPRIDVVGCQSASKFDPVSASNFDPLERRVLAVALAPSELAGVAETGRVRVGV